MYFTESVEGYRVVQTITLFWFDIGLPYLAYGCITMRQCVSHTYNSDITLTFDLKVKFVWFMTWLCFFCPLTVILCLARECITMVLKMCRKHS